MAISVVMPALEMAQETGKLLAWRKKEGDQVAKGEPLKLQFDAFLDSIASRISPKSSGASARRTLAAALAILDKIEEHAAVVSQTLVDVSKVDGWKP